MAKKSEIIGEFIITINDNNSVEVSRIYKSTKGVLKGIWTNAGKPLPEKDWNTQDWGRNVLKEFCAGERKGTIGEYDIEREDNNRINVIRTYSNAKQGLREVAKELKFPYPEPNDYGWNTQRFGSILVKFAQTGELPNVNPKAEKEVEKTEALQDSYPTYAECVAKYPVGPKGNRYKISEDGKKMYGISDSLEGPLVVPEGVEIVVFDINDRIEGMTAIIMPDSVKEMKGWLNCNYCENLKALRLAPGMKLPSEAFYCLKMENIELPQGISVIPSECFKNGSLKSVTLPSGLEFILPNAFDCCNLEEVVIPTSVKVIFSEAFINNSDLKKVTFLSPDTKVMPSAFDNCDKLENVEAIYESRPLGDETFGQGEEVYGEVEKKNWRDEVTDVSFELISVPEYYCGPLLIKEGAKAYPELDDFAGITELYIPDSIADKYPSIPINVRKVRFPDSLERIDLQRKASLREFNWPASAKIFYISQAPIATLSIPEGVTEVHINDMPELTELQLPSSLITLDLDKCPKLVRCDLPVNLCELSSGSFSGCTALEELSIPVNCTTIPRSCASGNWGSNMYLKKLYIPNGVEVIGEGSFQGNELLTEVTIPASVKRIEAKAFADCPKLTTVNIEGTPLVFPDAFANTPGYKGDFVELATVEKTETGLPLLKMTVDQIFFKKNWYDNASEFLDNDGYYGECVAWESKSADQSGYPLDKSGFLTYENSASSCLNEFYNEDEDACDSMLGRGYYMVAYPEGCGDIEFGYGIMEKTCAALALILNPDSGRTIEEYPYTGPEAIVELNVKDFGEDEILHTYRYHIYEKDGEWVAEKVD
ncbi:MAG: leucine-rich repeat domain-containing protein [Bacteroides sp.]|nr:leucine-rich repeat domain-containing protein [Bacteroides sp.]